MQHSFKNLLKFTTYTGLKFLHIKHSCVNIQRSRRHQARRKKRMCDETTHRTLEAQNASTEVFTEQF
jgi:hypothetical protein